VAPKVSTGEPLPQLVAFALTKKHRFWLFLLSNFLHYAFTPQLQKQLLA